jgi:hypothetical protein
MIALLEIDMARLQEALGGDGKDITDLPSWLARLETQYAMTEQHSNHAGASAGDLDSDKETTFF